MLYTQDTCLPSSDKEVALHADMGLQQTAMNVVLQVLQHPALETSGLIRVAGEVGSVPKGQKEEGADLAMQALEPDSHCSPRAASPPLRLAQGQWPRSLL